MTVSLDKPAPSPEQDRLNAEAVRQQFEQDASDKALRVTVDFEGSNTSNVFSLKMQSRSGARKLVTTHNPNIFRIRKPLEERVDDAASLLTRLDEMPALSAVDRERKSAASLAWLTTERLSLSAPVRAGSEGKEAFDLTQRDRRMFGRSETGGSGNAESYATELFVGALNPELISDVADSLDRKTVFNLGGGNSKLSAELAEHGAHTEVVNVEPYPSEQLENATAEEGYDHLLQENPASPDFFEKSGLPEQSVDEVWAVFSVPAYLGTAGEVSALFDNVTRLVKPGGIVRISHLGVVNAQPGDERVAAMHASLEVAKEKGFLIETSKSTRGISLFMTAPEQDVA